MNTVEAATGKWRGILLHVGLDKSFLTGRHGPCPMCGGTDRFRWDDKEGSGSFFCSQCGAGKGFDFLKRLKGWDFKTAAREVDSLLGVVATEPPKPKISEQHRRHTLNCLWRAAERLSGSDPVSDYLKSRKALYGALELKFHPSCPKPFGGGSGEAMLARVTSPDGSPASIHRTFLEKGEGGRIKALMPGDMPDGASVRLFPPKDNKLGIAEGIETAICASQIFDIPVWSAINATNLVKWTPPEGVNEIWVFGDNDATFTGQQAAYTLAKRLVLKHKLSVHVRIPEGVGQDWADEIQKGDDQ